MLPCPSGEDWMLFVCEQQGQWRVVTGRCCPVERLGVGGDAGQNGGDVHVPQSGMSYGRV